MAVAASLNVNLTATTGNFSSNITKAGGTLTKLGKTASTIGSMMKFNAVAAVAKKAFNFVTDAIGDIDKLVESAKSVGIQFSSVDASRLGTVQTAAAKISGTFDAMKLQLLVGLAPGIQFVSDMFTRFSQVTVGGFTLIELYGKYASISLTVLGKGVQIIIKMIAQNAIRMTAFYEKMATGASQVAAYFGDIETAMKFDKVGSEIGKISKSLTAVDNAFKWEEIFSWPDFKATAGGIITESQKVKEAIAPAAISFGSQADALFSFKRREAAIRERQAQRGNPQDKQAALLTGIKGLLARIERNTAAVPTVFNA